MKNDCAILARQNAVTGKPPRIAPIPQEALPAEAFEERDKLLAALGLPSSQDPIPEYHATLYKAPELMRARSVLSNYLFRGSLPPRDRELAILRVAWLLQAPYEWGEHVKIAKRLALTEPEIVRVRQGSAADGWSLHDRAILQAVEELVGEAMISDETWAALARTYSEPQLLELPVLVGQYIGVAYLQNSVRLRLQPGNHGLLAP